MESIAYDTTPRAKGRQAAVAKYRSAPKLRFPNVVFLNGRGYVLRSDLNRYKAELLASALGVPSVEPPLVEPDPLVPLKVVSAELGVGCRTIGRRIDESQAAARNEQALTT
jgi:hypothetical protein